MDTVASLDSQLSAKASALQAERDADAAYAAAETTALKAAALKERALAQAARDRAQAAGAVIVAQKELNASKATAAKQAQINNGITDEFYKGFGPRSSERFASQGSGGKL